MLGLLVSWLAAALLAFTIFFYVVVYTMWLKRSTPQNIVIGGAAGAFPPVIGWAAVTGGDRRSSRCCCSSSSSSGRRRISGRWRCSAPTTTRAPACRCCRWSPAPQATRRQILLYSLLLVPVGAAPWLLGYAGLAYGVTALVAGALMVAFAWRVLTATEGERAAAAARQLFAFSILYLFVLFAVLLVEARRRGASAG